MEKLQIRGVDKDCAMWFRLMATASGRTMGELFNDIIADYIDEIKNNPYSDCYKLKNLFGKEE